ncbi:SPRY domain-containing protein [Cryptosporidium muris RN66]|uniref:SPRY domain-containing protein n=1 Tax=Cryptosporidium muris (strain RN66) TaxID=441375 RepID=B6AGN2_CRYMR|nr:SPRY domain-containing protein [Cryptosporidium muris RN66]EEA07373.1 SPRY domain-containing protein [Cryptosporidium muris RN66]|eukprot:XP_002141722.1 SPRY domain-containing protein [Cryptosporidium muris RN66]
MEEVNKRNTEIKNRFLSLSNNVGFVREPVFYSQFKKIRKGSIKKSKVDNKSFPVFSVRYKDSFIELSEDRFVAKGYKGWSSVLLSHGSSSGSWYFEITIGNPVELEPFLGYPMSVTKTCKPSIRVGWSCRYSRYDVPVGTNSFGFSLSSSDCSCFNNGKKRCLPNYKPLNTGDIVGCFITLNNTSYDLPDPLTRPELHPFVEMGLLCNPDKLPPIIIDKGSKVQFSVNGKVLETNYTDIPAGFYHPALSLYMGATAVINIGPEFNYTPNVHFLPICKMQRPCIV